MLVEAVWYSEGERREAGDLADVVRAASCDRAGFVWAGLHDPVSAEIAEVARIFGLHPLAVEDAIKAKQRPKAERYDDWLFVVLKTALYLEKSEELEFGEIQIFARSDAIVVLRRGEPVPLGGLRSRLEAHNETLVSGPIAVLHAVVDEVVDAYQHCLTGLDDDVNEVELAVFAADQRSSASRLVERIYFLQREILELHRALVPLGTAMVHLRADEAILDDRRWDAYFRDIDDHLLRQQDQLSTLRDLLSAALNAHATQITLRQNEDMRRISAWVAIVAVPTMIAGIYGMNFQHMPELEARLGYPLTLGVMAVVCVGVYRLFRRSGWL